MNRKSGSVGLGLMCILVGLFFTALACIPIVKGIVFNRDCGAYLERASQAPTPDIARVSLDKALAYLNENHMTEGNTYIIIPSPNDTLEWLYSRVSQARKVLDEITVKSTPLEVSNVMIRMKDSISEQGESGEHVILPVHVALWPYQLFWIVVSSVMSLLAITFFLIGFSVVEDR